MLANLVGGLEAKLWQFKTDNFSKYDMRTFTNQKTISAIKRQTYVGNKSTFASVGTATGYLRPLSEEQSSLNGVQFGRGFLLIIETDVDIREGDKVTIETKEYTVQGEANHDRGEATAYKRCLITLPEKQ